MKKEFNINNQCDGFSIRRYLRTNFPHLSQVMIHKFLRLGEIKVNNKKVDVDYVLCVNDKVQIWDKLLIDENDDKSYTPVSNGAFLKNHVLEQNEDFWAFNKPVGLAMQGGSGLKTNMGLLLENWMSEFDQKPYIVHRLDRFTSGACIIGTNYHSANALCELFKERRINKHYIAVCECNGRFGNGRFFDLEGEIKDDIDGKKAITKYKVEKFIRFAEGRFFRITHPDHFNARRNARNHYSREYNLAVISFFPHTGRKHQIRIHASKFLWPILGDDLYNEKQTSNQIHLHSSKLIFNNATDKDTIKNFKIHAPLPAHIKKFDL